MTLSDMSIYLLQRGTSSCSVKDINNLLTATLSPDDVDLDADRFSFDGVESESLLLTGDRVQFERTVGKNLQLVDGVTDQTGVTEVCPR